MARRVRSPKTPAPNLLVGRHKRYKPYERHDHLTKTGLCQTPEAAA